MSTIEGKVAENAVGIKDVTQMVKGQKQFPTQNKHDNTKELSNKPSKNHTESTHTKPIVNAHAVLVMDSNRQFIDPDKFWYNRTVQKL